MPARLARDRVHGRLPQRRPRPGVTNWWDNGGDAIAFGRGSQGYVALNHESGSLTRTFQTSLAIGTYCDVQSDRAVTVNGSGQFTATLGADTALALHTGARDCDGGDPDPVGGASFNVNATTQPGENIYVVGSIPQLGDWNPAQAIKLSSDSYPVWKYRLSLPAAPRSSTSTSAAGTARPA